VGARGVAVKCAARNRGKEAAISGKAGPGAGACAFGYTARRFGDAFEEVTEMKLLALAAAAAAPLALVACTIEDSPDVAFSPQPSPVVVNPAPGYYGPYGYDSVVVTEPDYETIDDSRGVFEGDFGLD
jgi:hypothetical protein